MLIGYARISTEDQKMDLQIDALIKYGVEPEYIWQEQVSGVKTKREQLEECLRSLRPRDSLVVWRLDRLGRSLIELVKLTQELEHRGIELISLTENIDTATSSGRLVFNIFASIAQFERDIISERTKAGLAAARARGNRGGRKPKLGPKQIAMAKRMLKEPTVTHPEVAAVLKVATATLYRALERDKKEAEVVTHQKEQKRLAKLQVVA